MAMVRRKRRRVPKVVLVDVRNIVELEAVTEQLAEHERRFRDLLDVSFRIDKLLEQLLPLFEAIDAREERRSAGAKKANRTRREEAEDLGILPAANNRVEFSEGV